MTSLELLICVSLILVSAYMSASEIALFSLSRFQLRYLKENFYFTHKKIKYLLSDPGGLLITILVINEVINISITSLITEAISRNHFSIPEYFANLPRWAFEVALGTIVTAPVILFFCEITPKVIAAKINQLVATLNAGPLCLIYDTLSPVRFLLKHFVHFILLFIQRRNPRFSSDSFKNKEETASILKESDFLLMVEEGHKEGAIQENELELIKNVFELDNTTVAEIATPLSKVLSLTTDTTIQGALIAVRSQRYSRIPVLNSNRKEVVGILYSKDLLRCKLESQQGSTPIAALMRKPFFVSSSVRLNTLFRKFKEQKIHMAIVKGPNNEITGVITMSDILDALFEDLFLEVESDHLSRSKQNDSKAIIQTSKPTKGAV